jgi:hypothetical protein
VVSWLRTTTLAYSLLVLILLFVPETKALTLEELDTVFSVPSKTHAAYGLRQVPYAFKVRESSNVAVSYTRV